MNEMMEGMTNGYFSSHLKVKRECVYKDYDCVVSFSTSMLLG